MKKFLFIPALCLLFASCGGDKGPEGGGVPSLKVEPSSLDFAAVSAPSQSVTVTAVNVEWEVRVSDTASAWLKAEKTDGTTVTVSVTDNGTPEQRTGSFTVVPTNNEDVKAKSVTVVQTGSDVEYKFAVEPAALTFDSFLSRRAEQTQNILPSHIDHEQHQNGESAEMNIAFVFSRNRPARRRTAEKSDCPLRRTSKRR